MHELYLDISGGLCWAIAGARELRPVAVVVEVPRLEQCLVLRLPDIRCVITLVNPEKGMILL